MSVAFATRRPTKQEIQKLRLVLSTYRDGSGMVAAGEVTLPGWRDFERAVAAVLGGKAPESKGVFDVSVPSTTRTETDYGFSVKSKALTMKGGLAELAKEGRVYMELSNSPAKFLKELKEIGLTMADFSEKKRGQDFGESVLKTVQSWHSESKLEHEKSFKRKLDLEKSRFLVLSYHLGKGKRGTPHYQWHSFALTFPEKVTWKYTSDKCLRGYDPDHTEEALFDLYLSSGGQLKYYPRASTALYSSSIFQLAEAVHVAPLLRAARMYPKDWLLAGGKPYLDGSAICNELEKLKLLSLSPTHAKTLDDCISLLKSPSTIMPVGFQ